MNNLSRNKPIALIVGAAGFIGSSLTEKLLEKGIQVIGVDNFSSGARDNITEASKSKDFHLVSQSLTEVADLELTRLDYAVYLITEDLGEAEYGNNFQKFLDLCASFTPKIVLCSSVNLYDSKQDSSDNLKLAEKKLAQVSVAGKINARVVRLSSIFGPRMNFRDTDPMTRLIKSAVQDKLNLEQTPLEFTTRALYITDAVDLLIKAMMHGFTAQKIYDGVALEPIKVAEIKQVLMDPLWYEEKGFKPTELPPWSTPNLNKTIKELSWKPHTDIIIALKETLAFFKEHTASVPKEEIVVGKKQSIPWQFSKLEEEKAKPMEEKNVKPKISIPKINLSKIKHKTMTGIGLAIIFFALIFPILKFGFFAMDTKTHLENSIKQTSLGNFDLALQESNQAIGESLYLANSFNSVAFIKNIDALKNSFDVTAQSLGLLNQATNANFHTVTGAKLLASAFAVISGEKAGDTQILLNDAKTEFSAADNSIALVSATLKDQNFTSKIPSSLQQELNSVGSKMDSYHQIINLGMSLADLLPQIIATDSLKSYLIVLQDNRILRPGGGILRSYVQVTFDHGKLKGIKGDTVENLDHSYDARIDPPVELKNDLGESNWRLKDASFDPDFPTSAKDIAWFYNKESGTQVAGVIALDLVSAAKLLEAVGPLKIGTEKQEINSTNLAAKIAITREGNQVAADILQGLVERIFYLSKQNWVILAKNSEESLSQKHLLLYLADTNAFSYLSSNNWTGSIPKQKVEKIGERNEFLMFSEINMTQGQDSSAVERTLNIDSKIDNAGTISHKLSLNLVATDKLTGPYKMRLKIYLPISTKMLKTTWGDKVIKDLSPFSDYGLSGYSMLLEIGMGEQKQLVMEYQDLVSAKFDNNTLKYQLNMIKQVGQESIPVNFKLTFPEGIKATGDVSKIDHLSQDKTFTVVLQK